MQVNIVEGCIACGLCESICPEIFTVLTTAVAHNEQVPGFENECREARDNCPVNVIQLEE